MTEKIRELNVKVSEEELISSRVIMLIYYAWDEADKKNEHNTAQVIFSVCMMSITHNELLRS